MLAFAVTMLVSHSLTAALGAMFAVGAVFFLIRRFQGA